jgi:Fungal chitosanase of glycosyl hydrolase group 75
MSASSTNTAAEVLAAVKENMTPAKKVNQEPHRNTQTQKLDINVYQVALGFFAYTSSMAIDTDGSDSDPDPDHQDQTTWQDDEGHQLGAHHVPYYVLGDICPDRQSPCKWFYYREHDIAGLQFALIFYRDKCIGAVFGDTQGPPGGDPKELGEASVKSAQLLGIPSSGTTGGVDNGVTVVVFSGSQWVVHGTNSTLNANAQALVQKALNILGDALKL